MRTVGSLTRLRSAVEAENWQQSIQQIFEIEYNNQSPEVVQLCGPFLETLREYRRAKEQAAADRMAAAVKKAGETLLAAKDSKELDQIIADLSASMRVWRTEDTVNESDELRRARIEVSLAEQYVRRWQESLASLAIGKESEASTKMQALADQNYFPIVPRSEVLARATRPRQEFRPFEAETVIKEICSKAKSLDNLDEVVGSLQNWQQQQPNRTELQVASERISGLRDAYRFYLAGQYSEAFDFFMRRPAHGVFLDENISNLQRELLGKLLPHYLGLSSDGEFYPNELPAEYLLRTAREASQKQNWPLASRTMEAFRAIAFNNGLVPSWVTGDIAAFKAIAAGERLEKAQQFADAVTSFRAALESDSQNVPVDVIGQRLNALRKNHPEAFVLNKPPRPLGPGRVEY